MKPEELKKRVIKNAKAVRKMTKSNIIPLETKIEEDLYKLFPHMDKERVKDWATDICYNTDINESLDRMEKTYNG